MTGILTVCTGNICRSPAAEYLLARALGDSVPVSSSGTYAVEGLGVTAPMLRCLDAAGLDGRAHRARQFSADLARSADLVICMTARHRDRAMNEAPFAADRTFLLTELASAAQRLTPPDGSNLAARVANIAPAITGARASLLGPAHGDVADPYGQSQAVYDACFDLISEAVANIAAWVRA